MSNEYIKIVIPALIIFAVFAYAWRKGHLLRLTTYSRETREELRKCTWPTWDELKGATVVVMISIAMLGFFTIAADYILVMLVSWMTKI